MPIDLQVFRQIRVVPVRFTRCVDPANADATSGPVRADCPEPDDRGYLSGAVRGPVLPIAFDVATGTSDTAHVKLMREGIETTSELFVQSADTSVVDVDSPAAGAALPRTRNMVIRLRSIAVGDTRIRIRFGTLTGLVIAELRVLVTDLIPVQVCLHRTTITGAGAGATGPALIPRAAGVSNFTAADALLTAAGTIWRPHGVRFVVAARRDSTIADVNNGILSVNAAGQFPQFPTLMGTNRFANAINIHFIRQIGTGSTLGLGLSLVGSPGGYGIALPDGADLNDLAHEIGHVLDLAPGPAGHADDNDATTQNVRNDLYTIRRLMHSFNPFTPPQPHLGDIGYGARGGNTLRGALISVKDLAGDPADGDHPVARGAARPPLP